MAAAALEPVPVPALAALFPVNDIELPEIPVLARLRTGHGSTAPARWRLSGEEVRVGKLCVYPDDAVRPRTRADCVDGPRPCPWVSCRFHLYLDVSPDGAIKFNHPELEPWELEETCALDVAEAGATLERVGELVGLVRERVRQIEVRAMARARLRHPDAQGHYS